MRHNDGTPSPREPSESDSSMTSAARLDDNLEVAMSEEEEELGSLQLPPECLWQDSESFLDPIPNASGFKHGHGRRGGATYRPLATWDRASLGATAESSTEATTTPFAAEMLSSASSGSLLSKSVISPSLDPRSEVESEGNGGSHEGQSNNQRRPRVRLSERASRVAVCPQHGSRFLDPVSLMGLVQRQQQICASARRSEDLASINSGQSLTLPRLECRSNSQTYSCSGLRPLLQGVNELFDHEAGGFTQSETRSTAETTRIQGRQSYPQAISACGARSCLHPSATTRDLRGLSRSRRKSTIKFPLMEPLTTDRHTLAPQSLRKRIRVGEPTTDVDQDMLWLAVQHHQASFNKRRPAVLRPKDEFRVEDKSLFTYSADSFGMCSPS